MKPLMINATDRDAINIDNYQFYFNKLFFSKGFKNQNDVLTKETVKADGLRLVSTVSGIIATCFMIYNCIKLDTAVSTASNVAAHSSTMSNGTSTLFGQGYGTPSMLHHGDEDVESCLTGRETSFMDQGTCLADMISPNREPALQMRKDESSLGLTQFTDQYLNKKTGTLNKKGRDDLNNLNRNNQTFRDKIKIPLEIKPE